MNNNLLFSIIIPAYNSSTFIDLAIRSIIEQTYDNLELIIVNDGSEDNTLEIANNYASKDKRIKIISKKNGGYVSAVNVGLDNIKGDYFLFMGSDDYLDKSLLQTISEHIKTTKPDVIVFKSMRVEQDKKILDTFSNYNNVVTIDDKHFFEEIIDDKNGVGLLCNRDTSKLFKTSKLGKQRYYGKTGVDADDVFAMRFSRKSESFLFIPFIGYYWTVRPDSITGKKPSMDLIVDTIKVCDNYFQNLDTDCKLNYFELQYLQYYYYKVISLIKDYDFIANNCSLIKSFYKHCHHWLVKYRHIKKRHSFAFTFPFLYYFLTK